MTSFWPSLMFVDPPLAATTWSTDTPIALRDVPHRIAGRDGMRGARAADARLRAKRRRRGASRRRRGRGRYGRGDAAATCPIGIGMPLAA